LGARALAALLLHGSPGGGSSAAAGAAGIARITGITRTTWTAGRRTWWPTAGRRGTRPAAGRRRAGSTGSAAGLRALGIAGADLAEGKGGHYGRTIADQPEDQHYVAGLHLAEIEEGQQALGQLRGGAPLLVAFVQLLVAGTVVQETLAVGPLHLGQLGNVAQHGPLPVGILRVKGLLDPVEDRLHLQLRQPYQELAALRAFLVDVHLQHILVRDRRVQGEQGALPALGRAGVNTGAHLPIAEIHVHRRPERDLRASGILLRSTEVLARDQQVVHHELEHVQEVSCYF